MPLEKSPSNQVREKNIAEMIHSGHPVNQSVAAGYSVQREAEKHHREKEKYGR